MTLEEILANIKEMPSGCREWQRCKQPRGYGTVWFEGKSWLVHRLLWVQIVGPVCQQDSICHKCDNPPCCRISHLFKGSHYDNMRDMVNKGRASGGYFLGSEVGDSKLTEDQVLKIRKDTRLLRIVAKEYGVRESAISRIKNRKRWGWLQDA